MRVAGAPRALLAGRSAALLAPLLRARRGPRPCAPRSAASAGGEGRGEGRDESGDGGNDAQPHALLAAPPEDWAYGLRNPRRALGLQGVALGMLRLRAGEVRELIRY